MRLQAKSKIREYEILDRIGRGGMGAVYKARHIYLNKIRAIKVIHTALAMDDDFSERFVREARILNELNHPNLVRLYEFGTLDEGTFFMVMEYVQGENLLHRIRRKGRLSFEEASHITRDAALGLESAHRQGIVHRDISPDNILLVKDSSGNETVKIIDFGIAKALMENAKYTATNIFIGKPEYCSPEQTGMSSDTFVDHRSDIYSLGVCLYQMLSGKLPFHSTTPHGYLLKHVNESPLSILSHFSTGEMPDELDRVLRKAMAKKPADRYSSMREFADDLGRVESEATNLQHTMALQNPEASFQNFFDQGKKCFDELDWVEALRWWNKAYKITPDPTLQQWIAAAQDRLNTENEVHTVLSKELEDCEMLLYQGDSSKASQILNHVANSIRPELNLGEIQTRVATLRDRLVQPQPTPVPQKSNSNLWIWGVVIGAVFLVFLSVIAFFGISYISKQRATSEQAALADEVQKLIDEGRFREARIKIQSMPVKDERIRQLETLLTEREQNKAKSLYLEAEAAFNAGNIELANLKIKDLEMMQVPGYENQISSLKQRVQQFSNYNDTGDKTRTAIMQAMYRGDTDQARQLMQSGANINAADGNGYTVLMYAVWKTPDLVRDLLARGAKVDARDNRNVTALHVACDIGHAPSVNLLLDYGAELNVQNSFGATPLIVAATRGQTDIARILIEEGADLSIMPPSGYDALKTAEYYNHHEIANMIRKRIAESRDFVIAKR
jgi:serine/threonine protein kinase/ankyrin repeat protein